MGMNMLGAMPRPQPIGAGMAAQASDPTNGPGRLGQPPMSQDPQQAMLGGSAPPMAGADPNTSMAGGALGQPGMSALGSNADGSSPMGMAQGSSMGVAQGMGGYHHHGNGMGGMGQGAPGMGAIGAMPNSMAGAGMGAGNQPGPLQSFLQQLQSRGNGMQSQVMPNTNLQSAIMDSGKTQGQQGY